MTHKNQLQQLSSRRSQEGVALISVLLALMLLSAVALAMVFSANTETAINSNYRDAQTAEYAALAGIQEGRERLTSGATDIITAPAGLPDTTHHYVIYITNPAGASDTVAPWTSGSTYADTELCHENFSGLSLTNPGVGAPCSNTLASGVYTSIASTAPDTNSTAALNYKWVRITEKANKSASPDGTTGSFVLSSSASNTIPTCWDSNPLVMRERLLPSDGRTNCDSPPPANATVGQLHTVYTITSLAVSNRGTKRMVQADIGVDGPPSINAAIESNDNVILNGSLTANGYDNCSCSCGWVGNSTNSAYKCSALTTSNGGSTNHTACDGSHYSIFASGTIQNPTGAAEQLYSGNNPVDIGGQTFPYNIPNLVTTYSQLPNAVDVTTSPTYNWTCRTSGGVTDCGTQSNAQFGQSYFLQPNQIPTGTPALACSPNVQGCYDNPYGMVQQTTYIPGNVHLTSNLTGAGLLIVKGDLTIDGGLSFYGLILVSGSVRFTGGGSNPTNVYGGILSGTPIVDDTTLGGSASLQYDSCAVLRAFNGGIPRIISLRELPY